MICISFPCSNKCSFCNNLIKDSILEEKPVSQRMAINILDHSHILCIQECKYVADESVRFAYVFLGLDMRRGESLNLFMIRQFSP